MLKIPAVEEVGRAQAESAQWKKFLNKILSTGNLDLNEHQTFRWNLDVKLLFFR